jgi:inosine-uridine nucleoside N-ribohydrolase
LGKVPLLLDTDIGSDIDDAVALAYLLSQPRCELLGITTVTGRVDQRAALAEVLCRAAGREDVPIHAGAGQVLLFGPGQPEVPQYAAIESLPHRRDWGANTAVEFLRRAIRSRPGEVTLLAIGPMTNVALLFATDPEIPALLKGLVLMCGVFTGRGGQGPGSREWNALVDPIATARTYQAATAIHRSIGLEVTTQCRLPAEECRRRFTAAGGALAVVGEMAEVWFKHAREITFHDPLAAATIFEPSLCRFETGTVTVETASPQGAGLTYWSPGPPPQPHEVAVEVNPAAFFEHYFGVVEGG